MSNQEASKKLIEWLDEDAKEFDKIGDRLETLAPHLVGKDQQEQATREAKHYRELARIRREEIRIRKST